MDSRICKCSVTKILGRAAWRVLVAAVITLCAVAIVIPFRNGLSCVRDIWAVFKNASRCTEYSVYAEFRKEHCLIEEKNNFVGKLFLYEKYFSKKINFHIIFFIV